MEPEKKTEDDVESVELNEELEVVVDEAEKDTTVKPVQYEISSYGADIDAEGLVNRLRREDIFIPPFQRAYIWTQREASRFIESLLLGLPVPGVFFAKEVDSKKLLVIDGQQRLKTLEFYFDGYFNPRPKEKKKRVFSLEGVQKQFLGKTYEELEDRDRVVLNDSIIHATIIKQDAPKGDSSSIYHIFERLNNSGRKLSPQQIRVAIFNGFVIDALHQMNEHATWREIYGKVSPTLKDEELILRFLALYSLADSYKRPMKEFLNDATEDLKRRGEKELENKSALFTTTIDFIHTALGQSAFKPERAINAAVFDSVMVATARTLGEGRPPDTSAFKSAYEKLLIDEEYKRLISSATSDDKNVADRLKLATSAFKNLPAQK